MEFYCCTRLFLFGGGEESKRSTAKGRSSAKAECFAFTKLFLYIIVRNILTLRKPFRLSSVYPETIYRPFIFET